MQELKTELKIDIQANYSLRWITDQGLSAMVNAYASIVTQVELPRLAWTHHSKPSTGYNSDEVEFSAFTTKLVDSTHPWISALQLTPGLARYRDNMASHVGKLGGSWIRIESRIDDGVFDAQAHRLSTQGL